MRESHRLFETYLIENKSRYTGQKKAIVTEIFKIKTHFEIDDFLAKYRKKGSNFSRATVYRTVKQLLDAGLLQKISTQDGKVYYEPSIGNKQHDHVLCNTCGKIFEIETTELDGILEQYCQKIAFKQAYRSLHIFGECQDCVAETEK